ncbi:Asp23/Gls24 family envelope stress response protein [Serinibacter arcticus]|uniref:Asp23/Gls24 family envelope stress response protein n=1 Tax=Serinibacter arcticus TaxID=1655435 RepID=A0A2U1ZWL4_9MICO|nr:Asp23/Gls24 family envelope stress response protein [Serinibacter arcticus]PWD51333.1 Asp23/Gls24 family envelope stress response protein [Serinibacter arcticus]
MSQTTPRTDATDAASSISSTDVARTSTGGGRVGQRREQTSPLSTDEGTTTIADGVVSKIAGLAAREVMGVHDVGGGAARAFGSLRERIPGGSTNYSQGVNVEVGQEEAAVDLEIVAEFGVAISDVAQSVRRNVISSIERMTGLRVIEVNVNVNDVHLPEDEDHSGSSRSSQRSGGNGDDDGAGTEPRVR